MQTDGKIVYSIPDFYNFYNLNMNLFKLMDKHSEWFRDNIVIETVYGTFPGIIMNSGRVQFGTAHLENMISTIQSYNQIGIGIRYTFTNPHIVGDLLKDHYANVAMRVANDSSYKFSNNTMSFRMPGEVRNGVNVVSEELHDYIHENYSKLYTLWSTTKGLKTIDDINKFSENDIVVIPYQMNNTDAITKFEHPENIEILCCEGCIDNCPDRQKHYQDLSDKQAFFPSINFMCPHGSEDGYYYDTVPNLKHYISPEDIEEKYFPLGLNKFKITGRNANIIHVIEHYVNYFAKPEYRDKVRNHLLVDEFFPKNRNKGCSCS